MGSLDRYERIVSYSFHDFLLLGPEERIDFLLCPTNRIVYVRIRLWEQVS
jgi:hypothetical protein